MRVKMLKTVKGSPDGLNVYEYAAGTVHDLPPRLSEIFTGAGFAIEVPGAGPQEQPEIKARERKPRKPAEQPARRPTASKGSKGRAKR